MYNIHLSFCNKAHLILVSGKLSIIVCSSSTSKSSHNVILLQIMRGWSWYFDMEVAKNVLYICNLDTKFGFAHHTHWLTTPRDKDKLDTLRISSSSTRSIMPSNLDMLIGYFTRHYSYSYEHIPNQQSRVWVVEQTRRNHQSLYQLL